jgi:uncharacterized alkaline shock family protein YloU
VTTPSTTTTPAAAVAPKATPKPAASPAPAAAGALESTQGRTTIADPVVAKIAGIAAREVSGVYGFGGGAARALGALTERIPGGRASSTQGVSVEVGERQAAVDLTIVVEYGVAVAELARAIRRNVIGAIEQMTGLEVVEVNINVVDLHLPSADDADGADRDPEPAPARSTTRVQ